MRQICVLSPLFPPVPVLAAVFQHLLAQAAFGWVRASELRHRKCLSTLMTAITAHCWMEQTAGSWVMSARTALPLGSDRGQAWPDLQIAKWDTGELSTGLGAQGCLSDFG